MSIARRHSYRYDFLKSEVWQNIRISILARDDARCAICRIRDISNDVHHLKYPKNLWKDPHDDTIVLCRKCHEIVHEVLKGLRPGVAFQQKLIQGLRKHGATERVISIFKVAGPFGVKANLGTKCIACRTNKGELSNVFPMLHSNPKPHFMMRLCGACHAFLLAETGALCRIKDSEAFKVFEGTLYRLKGMHMGVDNFDPMI